jgi:hypothetical protein
VAWTNPITWVAGTVTVAMMNSAIRDNFKAIGDPWTAFTPTWASTGTAVSLGNGTITGWQRTTGKTIDFRIRLTIGSTTNVGTGTYVFGGLTAPAASQLDPIGQAIIQDVSVPTRSAGTTYVNATNSGISVLVGAGPLTNAAPYTLANGDVISLSGVYESV